MSKNALFGGNLGLHLDHFPSGKWGYVGSVPAALTNIVPATKDDVMGGRAFKNDKDDLVAPRHMAFNSPIEALENARALGFEPKVSERDQQLVGDYSALLQRLLTQAPEGGYRSPGSVWLRVDSDVVTITAANRAGVNEAMTARLTSGGTLLDHLIQNAGRHTSDTTVAREYHSAIYVACGRVAFDEMVRLQERERLINEITGDEQEEQRGQGR
jgi:hypothetical protein